MALDYFTIVVPVYNGEKTIEQLFARIKEVFVEESWSFKLVLVDDYSRDKSWEIITKLKELYPDQICGIKLARNFGQHNAILCGLSFSKESHVITMDDDLQIPPEEIPKLVKEWKRSESDVVYGIYKSKRHSFIRNFGSAVTGVILRRFASTPGRGSSFKLISKTISKKLISTNQNLVFLDEAIGWFTDHVSYVEVNHHPRKEGNSGYSLFRLAIMTLNLTINYTPLPLRFLTYFGSISSLVCLILGGYFIYMKYAYDSPLGFTATITAIFFSAGLILFSLGIIGEYIRRLYSSQTNMPAYSIRKVLE